MRNVRVAFCGCGKIAFAHARELRKLPGVELRACWNRTKARAEELAAEFGADYVADDFERIAADPDVDAVYVNTMHNDRMRILRPLAEAGKPVFMEKPLAHDAATLREMHCLLQERPILFQSGYKIRFHTLVRKARELVPEPEMLEAHVLDDTWPDGPLNDLAVGGANVRSQGVYATDSLQILAGAPPVAVAGLCANRRQKGGIEDTLAAAFEFANGALGTVAVADAGAAPDPVSKFLVAVSGANRSAALFDRYTRLEFRDGATGERQSLTHEEDGFLRQSEAFVAAVRGEAPVACDFVMGATPTIMVFEAIEAAKSGRRAAIDVGAWLEAG